MRTLSVVAWALVGATLVTAACGSSDEKHADRDAEAGNGGDAGTGGDVAAGGSEAPAGGTPTESTAGAPTNGGSGVGGDDAGGAGGGAGNAPLTLESLTGDWTATSIGTYACESSVGTFELKIDGANVSFPGWPSGTDGAGTIAMQEGGGFTFAIDYLVESEPVTMLGQLFVEPSARYGLLVAQSLDTSNGNKEGFLAVVQRTTPLLEVAAADFVGDWEGSSVRLDQTFAATAVLPSSGTFASSDEQLDLFATDDDGTLTSEGPGGYTLPLPAIALEPIVQGDSSYAGAFLMSPDKGALAGMLLTGEGSSQYGLCNQQAFADLSAHKFVLWTKAN